MFYIFSMRYKNRGEVSARIQYSMRLRTLLIIPTPSPILEHEVDIKYGTSSRRLWPLPLHFLLSHPQIAVLFQPSQRVFGFQGLGLEEVGGVQRRQLSYVSRVDVVFWKLGADFGVATAWEDAGEVVFHYQS